MKNWFENRKIKTKVMAAFTIVISICFVIAIIAIYGLVRLKTDMTAVSENLLPEVQSVIAIKECQTAIVAAERTLDDQGNELDERKDQYAVIEDQIQQIAEMSKTVDGLSLTAADAKAWQAYKTLQATFLGDAAQILEISKQIDAGGDQAVIDADYEKLKPLMEEPYDAVDVALDDMSAAITKENQTVMAASDRFSTLIVIIFAGLTVLAAIGIWLMARFVSGLISRPIIRLVAEAEKVSGGDLNVNLDIRTADEVGSLARAFQKVVNVFRALTQDVNLLTAAAAQGDLSARADSERHSGEYREIVEGFNNTLDAIVRPVQEMTSVLSRTAVNDLSQNVEGSYQGDMKVMADALNNTIFRLLSIQSIFVNMAKGDLSQLDGFKQIGRRSDNDVMLPSVITMMQTLNNLTDDANDLIADAAAGQLGIRGDASKYEGKYKQLIEGINSIMDAMVTPVGDAIEQMNRMASNDLTGGMSEGYGGDFARLAQSFNTVVETLNQTLGEIGAAADQVASGTQQVSAGSQALSQGATEQASAIEQLTASLAEIAEQTKQNAVNAGQASELANTAREEAVDGNARMTDLQRAMKEINDASANISKIIKVIDDIAFQTNLLALNAAVEAARAGQHGKGFAVVAEEVRNLAQRSASAAKETTEMIEESIRRVKDGTKIADDTAQSLTRIVSGVEHATELVGGIARASSEQATAVAQVNGGIGQVSQVVQTNSATAEQSAATSEELTGQAALLKEMVSRFALKGQASRAAGTKAPAAAPRALGDGKAAKAKPQISMDGRDFSKY